MHLIGGDNKVNEHWSHWLILERTIVMKLCTHHTHVCTQLLHNTKNSCRLQNSRYPPFIFGRMSMVHGTWFRFFLRTLNTLLSCWYSDNTELEFIFTHIGSQLKSSSVDWYTPLHILISISSKSHDHWWCGHLPSVTRMSSSATLWYLLLPTTPSNHICASYNNNFIVKHFSNYL